MAAIDFYNKLFYWSFNQSCQPKQRDPKWQAVTSAIWYGTTLSMYQDRQVLFTQYGLTLPMYQDSQVPFYTTQLCQFNRVNKWPKKLRISILPFFLYQQIYSLLSYSPPSMVLYQRHSNQPMTLKITYSEQEAQNSF